MYWPHKSLSVLMSTYVAATCLMAHLAVPRIPTPHRCGSSRAAHTPDHAASKCVGPTGAAAWRSTPPCTTPPTPQHTHTHTPQTCAPACARHCITCQHRVCAHEVRGSDPPCGWEHHDTARTRRLRCGLCDELVCANGSRAPPRHQPHNWQYGALPHIGTPRPPPTWCGSAATPRLPTRPM